MKVKMLSRQETYMRAKCECQHDRGDHRRLRDGTLAECVDPQCSCCEFVSPPANTTHIVAAVRRMQGALTEESDGI